MYGHFRDMRYRNLSDVSSLREGLNVQNAAKPEARHGASLQVQAMVQESSRPKEVCHEVCGGCGDWPDTTASAIRRAKYVNKKLQGHPPTPMPHGHPPFALISIQPDKIVERLVITALISPTPTKRLAIA